MSAPVQLIPNGRRPHVDAPERHTVLRVPLHKKKKRVPFLLSPTLRLWAWCAVVGIGGVLLWYGLGFLREGLGR